MNCRCLVFSFDAVASRISAFSLVEVLEDWFSFYDLSDLNDLNLFLNRRRTTKTCQKDCAQSKDRERKRETRERRPLISTTVPGKDPVAVMWIVDQGPHVAGKSLAVVLNE